MLGPLPFFLKRELLQYIGEVLRGFDNLKVNTSYFWTFGYLSQPWIVSREGRSSHQQKLAEHGYWPATNCKENAISLRHHATTYSCATNQMHTIYRKKCSKHVYNSYKHKTPFKCIQMVPRCATSNHTSLVARLPALEIVKGSRWCESPATVLVVPGLPEAVDYLDYLDLGHLGLWEYPIWTQSHLGCLKIIQNHGKTCANLMSHHAQTKNICFGVTRLDKSLSLCWHLFTLWCSPSPPCSWSLFGSAEVIATKNKPVAESLILHQLQND